MCDRNCYRVWKSSRNQKYFLRITQETKKLLKHSFLFYYFSLWPSWWRSSKISPISNVFTRTAVWKKLVKSEIISTLHRSFIDFFCNTLAQPEARSKQEVLPKVILILYLIISAIGILGGGRQKRSARSRVYVFTRTAVWKKLVKSEIITTLHRSFIDFFSNTLAQPEAIAKQEVLLQPEVHAWPEVYPQLKVLPQPKVLPEPEVILIFHLIISAFGLLGGGRQRSARSRMQFNFMRPRSEKTCQIRD